MSESQHIVAIVGGATAGAESARVFAAHGIESVVFEQNARPYGKVEDGLPCWHVKLRQKEFRAIDEKLDHPLVHYVPKTALGQDISIREILEEWQVDALVLALGAWRDRPIPIAGADEYIGRGLVYQNAFIHWYNHKDEESYDGWELEIPDGALVIGGGLASIDVAKACQFELTQRALRERGIEETMLRLEEEGIPAVLGEHGLTWAELGLKGTTICYRRRPEDMPLAEMPENATAEKRAKIEKVRRQILAKAMDKYLFDMKPHHVPVGVLGDGSRLTGLEFERTKVDDGRLVQTGEKFSIASPLVISSIGSLPVPVEGIPMDGELYAFPDKDIGTFDSLPNVFTVGNAVTGKGNLVVSRKHAQRVATALATSVSGEAESIAAYVEKQERRTKEEMAAVRSLVKAAQNRVGYDGDYLRWIESSRRPAPANEH